MVPSLNAQHVVPIPYSCLLLGWCSLVVASTFGRRLGGAYVAEARARSALTADCGGLRLEVGGSRKFFEFFTGVPNR